MRYTDTIKDKIPFAPVYNSSLTGNLDNATAAETDVLIKSLCNSIPMYSILYIFVRK